MPGGNGGASALRTSELYKAHGHVLHGEDRSLEVLPAQNPGHLLGGECEEEQTCSKPPRLRIRLDPLETGVNRRPFVDVNLENIPDRDHDHLSITKTSATPPPDGAPGGCTRDAILAISRHVA